LCSPIELVLAHLLSLLNRLAEELSSTAPEPLSPEEIGEHKRLAHAAPLASSVAYILLDYILN
jgi:hypothetical protein